MREERSVGVWHLAENGAENNPERSLTKLRFENNATQLCSALINDLDWNRNGS